MKELYNPFPKLPKNIRQIGERDDVVKLYMEDYVSTYLKRLYPTGGQDLRVGILLGNTEQHDGTSYVFVDGALEMEEVTVSGEKVTFSEAAWKKAYQSIEETFPKRTVQGWFLCGAPGCALSPLNYWKQHNQYFGGKNQIMYMNSGMDGDESLYITSDDGFYRIRGYSIYYERNQMMQDYMILRKDARRVESGTNDRVIRDFRQRMEGRKSEAVSRRGTIRTLSMLCSALSVAVLAGGVVMFNNYQKMKEMETVLVSVIPSGVKGLVNSDVEISGEDIIVEEIKGSVTPVEMETSPTVASGMDTTQSVVAQTDTAADTAPANTAPAETPKATVVPVESYTSQGEGDRAEPLDEPEQQKYMPNPSATGVNGGNATATRDIPTTNMKPGKIYVIGEGETLYGICFKLYEDLKYLDDICALNQISDVNRLIAGQELILPDTSKIQ